MQIRVINQSHWIVLSVLVSFSSAKALTTTVEPISINDGIWNVLSRLGQALDTLSPCIFGIQQTDMPLTITSPGYYCFNQDLIFTTTGIIIATDDVTVDFNSHTLDGQNNGNGVGIQLTNGVNNIVIKNGAIQNIRGSLSAGIADVNNGLILDNIMIQDMSFINIGLSAILLSNQAATFDVNGIIVDRCNSYDGGGFQITGNNIVIRSCILDTNALTTNAGCIRARGFSTALLGEDLLIEDTVITSTFGNNFGCRIALTFMYNVELRNCRVDGGLGNCFGFADIVNLRASDCVARLSSSVGFDFRSLSLQAHSIIFERCVAQNMIAQGFNFISTATIDSIVLTDCISQNNGSIGFQWAGAGSRDAIYNIVARNCTASNCGASGFAGGAGPGLFKNFVFENCVAQKCSGLAGFTTSSNSGALFTTVVFRNCIAQQNTGIGFSIGTNMSAGVIEGCIAQRNGTDGFNLAAATINVEMIQCRALRNGSVGIRNSATGNRNFIFGCTSIGNPGGDYVGVGFGDLTKIVSYSQIGATATADFWRNIRS